MTLVRSHLMTTEAQRTPASDLGTRSGAEQTRLIILHWVSRHTGLLTQLGLLSDSDSRYDLTQDLLVGILRKQTFPKSAFDPTRSSWSHYVWLACKSLSLNMGARLRVRPNCAPLPERWDPEAPDIFGFDDLLIDFGKSELGQEVLTRAGKVGSGQVWTQLFDQDKPRREVKRLREYSSN